MNEVFEALERLKTAPSFMGGTEKYKFAMNSERVLLEDYELVKSAVIELQAIKEANFSEAIRKLIDIRALINEVYEDVKPTEKNIIASRDCFRRYCDEIKQALLKAQEQEKENTEYKEVLRIIKEKEVNMQVFNQCEDVDTYNNVYKKQKERQLTQEEFDTLKRWQK